MVLLRYPQYSMLSKCTCSLSRPAWRHLSRCRCSTVSVSVPMLVPQPSFGVVSARPASAVRGVLPCPQSTREVHRSTFSTLATATGTWNLCRFPITPISKANLQLRGAQSCDFCSDCRIGSCGDVKKVVECASPRALNLQNRRIPAAWSTKSSLSRWSSWKVTHGSVINASMYFWVLRKVDSLRFIWSQTFCKKLVDAAPPAS